jgi:hypothetical protein
VGGESNKRGVPSLSHNRYPWRQGLNRRLVEGRKSDNAVSATRGAAGRGLRTGEQLRDRVVYVVRPERQTALNGTPTRHRLVRDAYAGGGGVVASMCVLAVQPAAAATPPGPASRARCRSASRPGHTSPMPRLPSRAGTIGGDPAARAKSTSDGFAFVPIGAR